MGVQSPGLDSCLQGLPAAERRVLRRAPAASHCWIQTEKIGYRGMYRAQISGSIWVYSRRVSGSGTLTAAQPQLSAMAECLP